MSDLASDSFAENIAPISLNLAAIKQELIEKCIECQHRGLVHNHKWMAELVHALGWVLALWNALLYSAKHYVSRAGRQVLTCANALWVCPPRRSTSRSTTRTSCARDTSTFASTIDAATSPRNQSRPSSSSFISTHAIFQVKRSVSIASRTKWKTFTFKAWAISKSLNRTWRNIRLIR